MIIIKNLIFFIFIFLFLIINKLNCQDIYPVDPSGKCEKYIGDETTPCYQFLTNRNSIYTSTTIDQSKSIATINQYFELLSTIASDKCQSSILTYKTLCSMLLPECESFKDNSTNLIYSIPKRVCYNTCTSVTTTCNIPDFLFSCKQNETFSKLPLFPIKEVEYNFTGNNNNSLSVVECYAPIDNGEKFVKPLSKTCPHPLIYHESTDHEADSDKGYLFVSSTSNCVVPNPLPVYTPQQWDSIFDLSSALSVLSCIGTLYLLFTFLILNKKITRFDKMHALFNGSVFMMTLPGVIYLFAGGIREALFKDNSARIVVWEDPICSATGFIFQLFSISAIFYWNLLAFDLWWCIKFINRPLNIQKYYIPITTVISLLFAIIPLATKNYRMIRGNIHCWVHTGELQNGLFWYSMSGILTIGTLFILMVMYEVYKVVRAAGRGGVFKLEIKPILNVVLIYITFVYIFAFNFYMNGIYVETYAQIEPFFKCTLSNPDPTQCTISGPSIGSIGYFVYCIRIFGVYVTLLHGFSNRAFKIWKKSFMLNNRFIYFIKSIIYSSSTPNNSGKSSNNSGTTGGNNNNGNNTSTTFNSSTTEGGGGGDATRPKNKNLKKLQKKELNNYDSDFSKNHSSDDEDDDYDPYHKKLEIKDIEIGKTNSNSKE